jgi:hypothetical protein
MDSSSPRGYVSAPPPTFIGLAFSLSGWALIGTALFLLHAGLQAHLIPTLMALYLIFLCTKKMKPKQRLQAERPDSSITQQNVPVSQILWALFLLIVGASNGFLILKGSVFVSLSAVALVFLPWYRIPLCRERILVSSVTLAIGTILPLLLFFRSASPLFLLVCGWLFWLLATFAVFRRIARLWQAELNMKAASAATLSPHA